MALLVGLAPLTLDTPAASAAGATIHVSPTGSDTAAGTSTNPVRTLARAVSMATSGSTVLLRGGTYRESVQVYGKDVDIVGAPGRPWCSTAPAR